jgi:hypothetical protein
MANQSMECVAGSVASRETPPWCVGAESVCVYDTSMEWVSQRDPVRASSDATYARVTGSWSTPPWILPLTAIAAAHTVHGGFPYDDRSCPAHTMEVSNQGVEPWPHIPWRCSTRRRRLRTDAARLRTDASSWPHNLQGGVACRRRLCACEGRLQRGLSTTRNARSAAGPNPRPRHGLRTRVCVRSRGSGRLRDPRALSRRAFRACR